MTCRASSPPPPTSRVSCTFEFYPLNLYAGHSGSVRQRLTRILNCCEHKFTELSSTQCRGCAQKRLVRKYSQADPDFRGTTSASSQEQGPWISTTRMLLLRLRNVLAGLYDLVESQSMKFCRSVLTAISVLTIAVFFLIYLCFFFCDNNAKLSLDYMWICGYMQIWWSMLQSLERWHFFTPESPKTKTEIWNLGKAVQKTASIFITTHLFILAATKFLHYSIRTSPHSFIPPILYIQYICSFKCMSMSVVEVYI